MAAIDYSRSVEQKLIIKEGRLFNGILDLTRSDGIAVVFTGKVLKMEIMVGRGAAVTLTLTSGTEFSVSTAKLTFDTIFSTLEYRTYYYRLYNDTDKIGIAHGDFEVA